MLNLKNKKFLIASAVLLSIGGGIGIKSYVVNSAVAETQVVQQAPQAKPVSIEVVEAQPIQIWKSFSARMAAVDYAELKPQVSGTITEIKFTDGQMVAKGDTLFVIDPRIFAAEVNQAKAELSSARTKASFARKELKRAKGLLKKKAVSQSVYDERINSVKLADADIQVATANLMQAEINLDHAYVKAPITGRVSRAEITLGNLVSAGANAPVLTSVVSSIGIYADFDVDENTYLEYIRPVAKDRAAEKSIPVKLALGKKGTSYEGFVHSFDNRINVASGTIRARAFFPNQNGALLPGMFGTLQLGSAVTQKNILVSEKAIGTNQDRKFVYVVDDTGTATYREVKLGNKVNGKRIISQGLKDGEQVISGGLMRIRPGMKVVPKEAAQPEIS
jgi:multidrug efflux system membrane fusion protein